MSANITGGYRKIAAATSREFQRNVVAEGVETVDHGLHLLRMGCTIAQGYGIARPMPAEDIPAWVISYRPDASWDEGSLKSMRPHFTRFQLWATDSSSKVAL